MLNEGAQVEEGLSAPNYSISISGTPQLWVVSAVWRVAAVLAVFAVGRGGCCACAGWGGAFLSLCTILQLQCTIVYGV